MQPLNRRPDPAPSRWQYKVQRLWLTPSFRMATRTGLPILIVLMALGIYLGSESRRSDLMASLQGLKRDFQERPEFMVKTLEINGAGDKTASAVEALIPAELPVSSFDLNLETLRHNIRDLDAVDDVSLQVRTGGVLRVDVIERLPVALWRGPEGIEVIDSFGVRADRADSRSEYPDLPLIVGQGAKENVTEALALLAAGAPLQGRLRGLVRVSNRRWDAVLDREQRILLPEKEPVRALQRVIALEQAKDLLSRDVTVVDMRLAERPTVRMSTTAHEEMLRVRALN